MNVVVFIICTGLFVLGMWLMGEAPTTLGFEAITFFGGIMSVCVALAVPFHIIGRSDGA